VKKKGYAIANWKMNLNMEDLAPYFNLFEISATDRSQIFFAPQTALLYPTSQFIKANGLGLCAQNCSSEKSGAFTGESSAECLKSIGASMVLVGHSERRQIFMEAEAVLSKKMERALEANLKIVYCIGETLQQRQNNQLNSTLNNQLSCLSVFKDKNAWDQLILAYEPVWAIGTGVVATLPQVQEAHEYIQASFKQLFSLTCPPILYGGSVNSGNAADLFQLEAVSGFLVGGSSLKPKDFSLICKITSASVH